MKNRFLAVAVLLALASLARADTITVGAGGAGGVSGTGTTNRLPKWGSPFSLLDSLLSDDGSHVTLTAGTFRAPAGSATAPSYSFTGDSDTGIYNSPGLLVFTVDGNLLGVLSAGAFQFVPGIFPAGDNGVDVGSDTLSYRSGYFDTGIYMTETTDPAAPGANKAVHFTRDNGSGKTQFAVRFPTGAVQVIATEP